MGAKGEEDDMSGMGRPAKGEDNDMSGMGRPAKGEGDDMEERPAKGSKDGEMRPPKVPNTICAIIDCRCTLGINCTTRG